MFTIKYDISKINVVIESDVDNCLSFFMPFCLLQVTMLIVLSNFLDGCVLQSRHVLPITFDGWQYTQMKWSSTYNNASLICLETVK